MTLFELLLAVSFLGAEPTDLVSLLQMGPYFESRKIEPTVERLMELAQ